MKRSNDWCYLSAMIVAAVLLRAPLVHVGLTIDDAFTAYVVEAQNWPEMIHRIMIIEQTPPLYYALLKIVTGVCGLTTPVLATTSLVFSVAVIPLVYLLGKACSGNLSAVVDRQSEQLRGRERASQVGLCAAFFATTSFLSILYGHEARAYSLAAFLVTVQLLLFVPFFDGLADRKRQIALFGATALAAYTHYTTVPYTCILIILSLIFRKHGQSRSLLAIPPMMAGLLTLLPWFPILKYHGTVGTPWVDPTPLTKFPTVFETNLSSFSPLPVVPTFMFVALLLPAILLTFAACRPEQSLAGARAFMHKPKLVALASLIVYSACVFGYITPYIFGYVRYMTPIAPAGWVLLSVVLVSLADAAGQLKKIQALSRPARVTVVCVLALITLAICAQNVAAMASQDRSGLRRLAREIASQRFGRAAYITSPDFVGSILTYYLKHESQLPEDKLPEILGFAYPDGGRLPPKHDTRAAMWQDPKLFEKYEGYLKRMQESGTPEVVLVRDTYTPTSKLIPTDALTNKLEDLLRQKCVQQGPTETYKGYASSYKVTRFVFPSGSVVH